MCQLREGEDLEAELKDSMQPQELEALLAATHRPSYVCQVGQARRDTFQLLLLRRRSTRSPSPLPRC